MNEDEERLRARCGKPGFLAELPKRGGGGLLALFDFPSRKLPRSREVLVACAPGDQEEAVARDDRERDLEPRSCVFDQAGAPALPSP